MLISMPALWSRIKSDKYFKILGFLFLAFPFVCFFISDPLASRIGDFYKANIFPVIRFAYDYTVGALPFPSFFWGLGVWVVWLVAPLVRAGANLSKRAMKFLLRLFVLMSAFYWLWGFVYLATPPQEKMGLSKESVGLLQLEQAYCRELNSMKMSRPDSFGFNKLSVEREIRELTRDFLYSIHMNAHGSPRVRYLLPKGVLLRMATAGVYMPYVFEAQIDAGMHPAIIPFTMSHEMAHAFGIGEEGACNLVAYLACIRSDNPVIRYSAFISYWKYLAREIRKLDKTSYLALISDLPDDIAKDLKEIDEYFDRYKDIYPLGQSKIYDSYLKAQGMNDGLKSYAQIVLWVESWYSVNTQKIVK